MHWINIVGYVGAFLTGITFIPQVYKAWQTKSVADISVWMLTIVFTSCVVWLVYSIYLNLLPIILANAAIGIMVLMLLYFKLTFRK
jgi:MtN3 and saliva related transmembrane protein